MTCEFADNVLHGYLDGELDSSRAAEFERHLESCRECAATLEAESSLRSALQKNALYERAPRELREKVWSELGVRASSAGAARGAMVVSASQAKRGGSMAPALVSSRWAWLGVAAAILLVGWVSWYAFSPAVREAVRPEVSGTELVDAHVRSLQPGHLTDVVSSDQHTVKPWFDGKIDFAPPVEDFAEKGYTLVGGRLDVLNGRSVAAIVYARRKHMVNVFVWPTPEADLALHPSRVHQGYQWIHWRHDGMEFCAVSDVSAPELRELAQLFLH